MLAMLELVLIGLGMVGWGYFWILSWEKAEKLLKDIGRLLSGKRDRCSHRCSPLKNKPYQGMCLRTPARTNAASVKAASTAHVSSERFRRRKLLVSCFDIGSLLIRN